MTVPYRRQEAPSSPELIERLEQRIGRPIPATYRDFLLTQDGGRLADNHEAVDTIFGLGDVPDWASLWDKLDVLHGRVPKWLLPVADDAYGNIIAISLRDEDSGSVWFWDHEEEAGEGEPPTEDNIELKAPDWSSFLNSLQPL